MAVRRSYNALNQVRVSVPDMKGIESAVRADFDDLLNGLVTGAGNPQVVRGFEIEMSGSIGSSASSLQVIVENSSILHGSSTTSGTFFVVPSGTASQTLSSTVNPKVVGSFTPSSLNFIGIEYVRQPANSTAIQRYFWSPATQSEFVRTAPQSELLDFRLFISVSPFSSNQNILPLAVVETDGANNVLSVEDRRPLLFRLGRAGAMSPDPTYQYSWDNHLEGRVENPSTSLSSSVSPFKGGDKQILSMKEMFDALMTEIKLIKGTPFWYSLSSGGSISKLRTDLANTVITSKGTIAHDVNIAGKLNWTQDINLVVIGSRVKYKILANPLSNHITLNSNEVAYIKLVRDVSIIPKLKFETGSTAVSSVGIVPWTVGLQAGDYIKDVLKGDEYYYEILTVDSLSQVTLTEPFQEPSSGTSGFGAQYAFGTYETSVSPTSNRHIFVNDKKESAFNQDDFWLFYRQDDGGTVPKIYVRMLDGQELEQGEEIQISDNTSLAVLNYMGSKSEKDSDPDYLMATGISKTNIHLTDGENLTKGIKRLEHRDDVIPRVRVVDLVSTVLPSGSSVTVDGELLSNNDYVMFTRETIEGLYKVSGVGVNVVFEKMPMFKGTEAPVNGDLIRVESGTIYLRTIWKRVAGYWKPLEVKDATKEPTGFPNRTDSAISFNNATRTFSIAPLAPSVHFDIFIKGRVVRFESAQEITITDDEGIFFFYFNENGLLDYSTVFDVSIITTKVFVSTIYWDKDNQEVILLGDERHGITMDGATHEYLHNTNGAVVTGGGNIGFLPYTGSGSQDEEAQISLTNLVFRDEDIRMDIVHSSTPSNPFEQILDGPAELPVYYRDGASGDWRKELATEYPFKQGTSLIQWNNPVGPWTQEDVNDGYFVSMWIFATNNINEPIIAIMGQKQHEFLSDAQEQDLYDSLSFGQMPTQEFKVLYRLVFQSSSAFINAPKALLEDVRDLRASQDTQFAQVAPNDHGLLSGLNDPDHGPTAVTTSGVIKDGGLSQTDVDVKQSLDTINKILGQLVVTEHPINKKRIKITGAERILNSSKNISVTLENLLLEFDGAEIDFLTGNVYKADGVTSLGVDFTPASIPSDSYIYYSITMVLNTVSSLNKLEPQLIVIPASSSNSNRALAPRAEFEDGIHIGQVVIRKDGVSIYDISNQDIIQVLYQGAKKLPFQEKGDILVFNGDDIVRVPAGNPDEVLTVDPTAPEGVAWKVNPGLGGLGLDEDGNFNLELVPETLVEWVLRAPDNTRYQVTVDNNGILFAEVTLKPVSPIFNFKNNLDEDCQILIDNTGILSIISPPLESGITKPLNLLSPSGYNWKIVIQKNILNINELITDTYNNQFIVKTENENHFAVKQTDEAHALVYVQVYNSESLPSTPQNIPGLLPFCFYNNGASSNLMYFDGNSWVFSTPPGTIQAYAGETVPSGWLLCNGQEVSRSSYSALFGAIATSYGQGDNSTTFNLPDYRGTFLRGKVDITTVTGSGTADSNQATFTAHGINRTGFRVRLSSGTLSGLAVSINYFAIVVDSNTLAFATTRANALNNTRIAISGANSAVIVQYEDPDYISRESSTIGSNSGSGVGSVQGDAIQSHNHWTASFNSTNNENTVGVGNTNSLASRGGTSGSSNVERYSLRFNPVQANTLRSSNTGGVETRPINTLVNYIIKY